MNNIFSTIFDLAVSELDIRAAAVEHVPCIIGTRLEWRGEDRGLATTTDPERRLPGETAQEKWTAAAGEVIVCC